MKFHCPCLSVRVRIRGGEEEEELEGGGGETLSLSETDSFSQRGVPIVEESNVAADSIGRRVLYDLKSHFSPSACAGDAAKKHVCARELFWGA